MKGSFEALKLSDHVYWVGAVDWGIRDFHGYSTFRGTTYNAYLIMGDDTILVDTVKAPFMDELLLRVSSVTDPVNIRYLISNHSEMDHSGSLPRVIERIKPEKVFASPMGVKALADHFHMGTEIVAVKDGEGLTLGNLNMFFVETRMLHWPDSMFTYLAEDRLLFSQDAFGMHLASGERYADEIPESVLLEEGAKYYANIILPYSAVVKKTLEKVGRLGLDISIIAPDHGPIWRKDLDMITGLYSRWAAQEPTDRAVVVFDTMWGSTESMARAVGEGLVAGGAGVSIMPLKSANRSDVITELLDAGALLVGSPTINNNMFPTVADFLCYARGLKPQNLIGSAFGSYGWSGEAVGHVADILSEMKVDPVGEAIKVRYVPEFETLQRCRALGLKVAGTLKGAVGSG